MKPSCTTERPLFRKTEADKLSVALETLPLKTQSPAGALFFGSVEKVRVTADQTAGAWPKILPIRNMKKAGSPTPLTKERKALMSEFMDSAAALVERATK